MSTRSCICYKNYETEKFEVIFTHYDGYPEHNGYILAHFYKSPSKIEKLMDFGNLSVLGEKVDATEILHDEEHLAKIRIPKTCVPYEDSPKIEFDYFYQVLQTLAGSMAEYLYLYVDFYWSCISLATGSIIDLYKEDED